MSKAMVPLLLNVLRDPDSLASLTEDQWDCVVRQARRSDLLARLAYLLGDKLDTAFRPHLHLNSANRVAVKQRRVVNYEVQQIQHALGSVDQPLILLKGAAYVIAGLPSAEGRVFSDIDILVPKAKLDAVERAMMKHGWQTTHLDEYDQRYYRTWMHELPPMTHMKRRTTIDIHHTILPETANLKPDADKLLAAIQLVDGYENIYTLSNADMVLHSATHLFQDGEFEHGLRDLVDLDALLRHFGKQDSFWDELVERAATLGLGRPLYYALRYAALMLETPIPKAVSKASEALGKPSAMVSSMMDALFSRALMPAHSSCDDAFTATARWLLYIRSHYLRMPPYLLVPHLVRKAIKNRKSSAPLNGQQLDQN